MPFAKCRSFEVDGTPIGAGCPRGIKCDFIHPSHPDWAKARDVKKSSGGGRGGAPSFGGSSTSSSGGWGAPPSSTPSTWSSSWAEAPKTDPSKTAGSSGWGDASKAKEPESTGWGSSTSGGWGDASAADATKGSGSWADAAQSAESGGWGSFSGGWSAPETHAKDSESEQPMNPSGSDAKDQSGKQGAPVDDVRGQGAAQVNPSTPPRNIQPEDVEMHDAPPASATSHRSSFSMVRSGSPTGTDATTSTRVRSSRHKAKMPVGPIERINTWEAYVETLSKAARAYSAKVDAEKERDRYKRLQNSSQFARVSNSGRQKLDDTRRDVEEKVLLHSGDLNSQMELLEHLPELSKNFLDFSSKVDEQEIISYVAEVKEWIESTRPLIVKLIAMPEPSSPAKIRGHSVEEGQIDDVHSSPTKRRHTSVEPFSNSDILARISHAEDLIESMHDDIHFRRRTTNVDQAVQDNVDTMETKKGDSARADPVLHLSNTVDELGNRVAREAENTASVLTFQRQIDQELTATREENQKLLQWQAQCQKQNDDMRKELDTNSALLQRMEAQMQQVLAQRQTPFHLSDTTRSQIRNIAHETINGEVDPAIIDFKSAVENQINGQHGQIRQILWQKLEPSLHLTEQIYQWLHSQIQKQG